MHDLAFIGDELTATGFRLEGARTWLSPPGEARECFEAARAAAAVVLLTPQAAAALPADVLEKALAEAAPLTLVVEDLLASAAPPDLEALMRGALGVEGT